MAKDNIIVENDNGFQILITGISWNPNTIRDFYSKSDLTKDQLPDQFSLELPDTVLKQMNNKSDEDKNNIIESFVYNFLTRKFGHEVFHCQIWLPFEENND